MFHIVANWATGKCVEEVSGGTLQGVFETIAEKKRLLQQPLVE